MWPRKLHKSAFEKQLHIVKQKAWLMKQVDYTRLLLLKIFLHLKDFIEKNQKQKEKNL